MVAVEFYRNYLIATALITILMVAGCCDFFPQEMAAPRSQRTVTSVRCPLLPGSDVVTTHRKVKKLYSLNSGNSEDLRVGTKNMRMGLIGGQYVKAFK